MKIKNMKIRKKYTNAVGTKFHENGSVRHYPGNTIICPVDPQSKVFKEALWVQSQLKETPFFHKIALLPPDSFHMTVFELLCDQVRVPDYWSQFLSRFASLQETDEFFKNQFAEMSLPPNFDMRFDYLEVGKNFTIYLLPLNRAVEDSIRGLRNYFSKKMGIRFPDHDDYRFHISLAYGIEELTAEETGLAKQIESRLHEHLNQHFGFFQTGTPQLTFFHDMFAFLPSIER